MDSCDFFRELRRKEDPTIEERLLLKYRNILCLIDEVCVSESKLEITPGNAIYDVRNYLRMMDYDDFLFYN